MVYGRAGEECRNASQLSPGRVLRSARSVRARTLRVSSSASTSSAPASMPSRTWRTTSAGSVLGVSVNDAMSVSTSPRRPHHLDAARGEFQAHRVGGAPHRGLGHPVAAGDGQPAKHRCDVHDGAAPSAIRSANADAKASGPNRLVSSSSRSVGAPRLEHRRAAEMPALLISTLTSDAVSAAAATDWGSVTSRVSATTRGSDGVDLRGVSGRGVDLGHPAVEQLGHVVAPHASVGSGDEDGLVLQ